MDLERLGSVLRERREALGIPAAEIARRVGVSPAYVWMVENARPRKSGEPSRPREAVLDRWTRALGMDERYARQVLRLGGYGGEEEKTVSTEAIAARPLAGPAMMQALVGSPVHFQMPPSLRDDVLLDDVRETLRLAAESGRAEEAHNLLESYLDWLRHRLRRR
jgi:transcriptional regulator with XRE-family HTH domain